MAAGYGRELLIKKGSTVIAGVQTKTVSINGEAIDITSDDDSGYRTMLANPGTLSLDLSVEGVSKDATLRTIIANGGSCMLTDITITYADGKVIAGDFFMSSFEDNGTHNDAVKFSCSLQSSGAFTYT